MADDPTQHESAIEFFQARSPESPAYVSTLVFVEACWVMSRSYGFKNPEIAGLFLALMESREIRFEDAQLMEEMFGMAEFANFDIADYLIAESARRAGCLRTVTFDRRAAQHIPAMDFLA